MNFPTSEGEYTG